jgi:hypothetical protein
MSLYEPEAALVPLPGQVETPHRALGLCLSAPYFTEDLILV